MTVEIGNTDAEGRLVLADAISLADEEAPDYLITVATLTGAARVALGPDLPPLYSDDDDFADGAARSRPRHRRSDVAHAVLGALRQDAEKPDRRCQPYRRRLLRRIGGCRVVPQALREPRPSASPIWIFLAGCRASNRGVHKAVSRKPLAPCSSSFAKSSEPREQTASARSAPPRLSRGPRRRSAARTGRGRALRQGRAAPGGGGRLCRSAASRASTRRSTPRRLRAKPSPSMPKAMAGLGFRSTATAMSVTCRAMG